jgi:Chs5-Arf1p-binding protein BUD7/BCH1
LDIAGISSWILKIGSYHYISGVDASTSASLAAYLNSLTYAVEDNSTWFAKAPMWKVRSGVYCCYNAFSRIDMRVDVKIPGGVHAYVVDIRGERYAFYIRQSFRPLNQMYASQT